MLPLDRTATVAQIVTEHGATARVFQRHEIDYLCRSASTVLEACRERHLDPEEVFAQLEDAIAAAAGQARSDHPRQLPSPDVVAHIVERHHTYVRSALPYIVPLLARVAGMHGKRNTKLNSLCDVGQQLADTLEAHLEEEERDLFPALLAAPRRAAVRGELEHVYRHHHEAGLLLARVRSLADGYAVPEWGDRSYQALMEELEALEEDVTEHMHLENCVFIPGPSPRSHEAH